MVRGHCPDCGSLVEIVTRGERQHPDRTSQWWYPVAHPHPQKPGEVCYGRRI